MTALSLVADVGGTNTRVGLAWGDRVDSATVHKFPNAAHSDLLDLLAAYLARHPGLAVEGAAIAVAGPVRDGAARLTNLDWAIDRAGLARVTGAATVSILNDLQAQGHAIDHLSAEALIPVLPGRPAGPNAAKLVIGIGTGFNIAPVFDTVAGRFAPPSEAGHVCLPVRSDQDRRLSAFIEEIHGFPGLEEVLSGRGLSNIHAFLGRDTGGSTRLGSAEILDACRDRRDPLAIRAVACFVRLLGQHAGDLCLTMLPFGGVYLAGGMARAVAPWLDDGFAKAFHDKGRFAGFLSAFAVTVIDDDYAALTGCAAHLDLLRTLTPPSPF